MSEDAAIPDADVTSRWELVEFHGSAAARSVCGWFGVVDLTAAEVSQIHRQIVRSSFRFFPEGFIK